MNCTTQYNTVYNTCTKHTHSNITCLCFRVNKYICLYVVVYVLRFLFCLRILLQEILYSRRKGIVHTQRLSNKSEHTLNMIAIRVGDTCCKRKRLYVSCLLGVSEVPQCTQRDTLLYTTQYTTFYVMLFTWNVICYITYDDKTGTVLQLHF